MGFNSGFKGLTQDDCDFLHISTNKTRASVVKRFFEFKSNPVIQTCNFGYYNIVIEITIQGIIVISE